MDFLELDKLVNKYAYDHSHRISVGINGNFVESSVSEIFVEPKIKVLSKSTNRFAQVMAESELPLSRYLCENRKALLVGAPGCGKTTILKFLSTVIFDSKLCMSYGMTASSIFGPISSVALLNYTGTLFDYIVSLYKRQLGAQYDLEEYFNTKFQSGDVVILMDGLNDIPPSRQISVIKQLDDICNEFSNGNRIVLTTRYLLQNCSYAGFEVGYIQEFDMENIEEYSSRIFKASGLNKQKVRETKLRFVNAISRNLELLALAQNPLFLSILTLLYVRQSELPHKRIELYSIYINDVISSAVSEMNAEQFSKDSIIRVLAYVAYHMTKNDAQNSYLTEPVLKNYIKSFFEKRAEYSKWEALQKMQLFFDQVVGKIGLFTYSAEIDGYIFSQYAIKEYLAALNICYDLEEYLDNGKKGRVRYREIIDMLFPFDKWHDIMKLVVEYIALINNNICSPIDVISHMINMQQHNMMNSTECAVIAGECLASLSNDFLDEKAVECRQLCQKRLINILGSRDASCKNRIRAARVLSHIGDTRFDDFAVIPEMVDIFPGTFEKGASLGEVNTFIEEAEKVTLNENDLWIKNYWREILLSEVSEKEEVSITNKYRISKYPITNMQYQVFLDENPDYNVPGWGDDNKGALYTWDEEKRACSSAYNNCPVVLVSWNDASNYCKWLSEKTGRKFRLPTEEEWEYAARGPQSSIYPWGNQWNDSYANTFESGINDIIAVGCFIEGISEFGVFDCSGQIWEWTSTLDTELWKKAWPSHMRSANDKEAYIVRGGAWDDISVFARCSSRGPNAASFYEHYIGFRVLEEIE